MLGARLGLGGRLGGARLGGVGSVRSGRGGPRSWRWLVVLAIVAAVVAAVLALAPAPAPTVEDPLISLPIEFDLPAHSPEPESSPATPTLDLVVTAEPEPAETMEPSDETTEPSDGDSGESSGRGSTGSSTGTAARPSTPTPEPTPVTTRRSKYVHDHHIPIRWVWTLPWWPLAVAALAASLWRLRRFPRPDGRYAPPIVDAIVAAAVIVGLMAIAITIPDATGAPTSDAPIKVKRTVADNGDIDILTTFHTHHFHPPIPISVHLLLFALALALVLARRIDLLRRTRLRRRSLTAA
jgi:hypothetical protein